MCPAVTAGKPATVYQAINAFGPAKHPDFGAAAHASYRLDPGVVVDELDSTGRPVYALRADGTATTAGACSCPCVLFPELVWPTASLQLLLHGVAVLTVITSGNDMPNNEPPHFALCRSWSGFWVQGVLDPCRRQHLP